MNPKDGLNYAWIPPGLFIMGCSPGDTHCHDNEKPLHSVVIKSGFWLGETPVTRLAFLRVIGHATNGSSELTNTDWPETHVSWIGAEHYCEAIGGRLPTEGEWEYAARANTMGPTYGQLSAITWYSGNGDDAHLHAVAMKSPNAWNLYDMLGNLPQWTLGGLGQYGPGERTDPQSPNFTERLLLSLGLNELIGPRVVRGGYRASRRVQIASKYAEAAFRCVGE